MKVIDSIDKTQIISSLESHDIRIPEYIGEKVIVETKTPQKTKED